MRPVALVVLMGCGGAEAPCGDGTVEQDGVCIAAETSGSAPVTQPNGGGTQPGDNTNESTTTPSGDGCVITIQTDDDDDGDIDWVATETYSSEGLLVLEQSYATDGDWDCTYLWVYDSRGTLEMEDEYCGYPGYGGNYYTITYRNSYDGDKLIRQELVYDERYVYPTYTYTDDDAATITYTWSGDELVLEEQNWDSDDAPESWYVYEVDSSGMRSKSYFQDQDGGVPWKRYDNYFSDGRLITTDIFLDQSEPPDALSYFGYESYAYDSYGSPTYYGDYDDDAVEPWFGWERDNVHDASGRLQSAERRYFDMDEGMKTIYRRETMSWDCPADVAVVPDGEGEDWTYWAPR